MKASRLGQWVGRHRARFGLRGGKGRGPSTPSMRHGMAMLMASVDQMPPPLSAAYVAWHVGASWVPCASALPAESSLSLRWKAVPVSSHPAHQKRHGIPQDRSQ
eukprot:scaffold197998_cov34-Tisochrysis_lutea.AAC.1